MIHKFFRFYGKHKIKIISPNSPIGEVEIISMERLYEVFKQRLIHEIKTDIKNNGKNLIEKYIDKIISD